MAIVRSETNHRGGRSLGERANVLRPPKPVQPCKWNVRHMEVREVTIRQSRKGAIASPFTPKPFSQKVRGAELPICSRNGFPPRQLSSGAANTRSLDKAGNWIADGQRDGFIFKIRRTGERDDSDVQTDVASLFGHGAIAPPEFHHSLYTSRGTTSDWDLAALLQESDPPI